MNNNLFFLSSKVRKDTELFYSLSCIGKQFFFLETENQKKNQEIKKNNPKHQEVQNMFHCYVDVHDGREEK